MPNVLLGSGEFELSIKGLGETSSLRIQPRVVGIVELVL